ATATLKQQTRRFAKRQLTWFRNRMAVRFDSISESSYPQAIYDRVERFLKEP
ncbi:TPA: tRNA (adenosine(37)-N6)-dimethylallyltransferase MiaA, partial [Streptococcus equi subsp. zooepidemicus]|nr:tRNA (adenosine(37)-N6)-dimethylallyltransferase MiaA [Streptococcus equi subsp. zooepidemicus]